MVPWWDGRVLALVSVLLAPALAQPAQMASSMPERPEPLIPSGGGVIYPTGGPPMYNCLMGDHNDWPAGKKSHCCRYQNIGCDSAPDFDCTVGLATWNIDWTREKKTWCCAHKGMGCDNPQRPFDCMAGLRNWRHGWSRNKKLWCCHHSHVACEHKPGTPHEPETPLFDCRAGLWNFRKAWSQEKKDWCCDRQQLGCDSEPDIVILPATDKPVEKCHGAETEVEACKNPACELSCEPVNCEFSDWSSWENLGGCYGLCQRERRIVQANNICGRPCHGPKVVTKAGGHLCVPDERCSMTGNIDCQWTDWAQWSDTCHNFALDQTHRWRRIAIEPSLGGRPCEGSFNETRACAHAARKDCHFSEWSGWTECSETCEKGTQSRLRKIDAFAEHGGKTCDGELREARACNTQLCPDSVSCVLTPWTDWLGCSETMFQRFRKREVKEVPDVLPSQELYCEYTLQESKGCHIDADAPHVCKLTPWSPWGECSHECSGNRVRSRKVLESMKKTCHVLNSTNLMEIEPCGEQDCSNRPCKLTHWSDWGACSHRCGPGITERKRAVEEGGTCETLLKEVRDCEERVCQPEDCAWGDWSFWSTCSKTCGTGVHRRHRVVKTAPRHGGKACDPKNEEEVGFCNNHSCDTCVNGTWGQWGSWGECSSTCKPAYKVRHRDPVSFPNHCGVPALGLEDEFALCEHIQDCQKNYDCMMSTWSLWSDCSCECFGIAERSRRIVRNAHGDGRPCTGSMKEVVPCNPAKGEDVPDTCRNKLTEGDCLLSEWNEWTECSASCDGGQRERVRTIVTPNKQGGVPCNDTTKEVEACGTEQCFGRTCQDCTWGDWSEWGQCSKCGGQRYRHRIVAKMPNFCGRPCDAGAAKEVGECHSDCANAAYCLWTEWDDASECNAQCGHASKLRQRSLTKVERRPMWGEYLLKTTEYAPCSGVQLKAVLCDYKPCTAADAAMVGCLPEHCSFNAWSMWGEPSCTQLCDRHRTIRQVNSCGGDPCEGATVETKHCVKRDCQDPQDCRFSDWHNWQSICINDQKVRFRVVEQPAANGGEACNGPTQETQPCDSMITGDHLLQDGAAGPWTHWSDCTRRCGGGVKMRSRSVEVEAKNGGYPFAGSLQVLEPCNQHVCSGNLTGEGNDCVLSDWHQWGECTASNMQYRNRRILQEAKPGGTPCEDGLRTVRQCQTAVNCRVSPWTPWDGCTRTCGGGQTTRHRQVTRNPRYGGKECPVNLIETTGCNDSPCDLDDAQVSAWTSWGACDTDCGPGQRYRKRRITTWVQDEGNGFSGPLSETSPCDIRDCGSEPQDCIWGEWTRWTKCDKPCGGGQKTRERRIAKVPRNGGKLCQPYDKEETAGCNTGSCEGSACVDGVWGEWAEWETCSSTCRGGVTWRSRIVVMEANDCGHPPLGYSMEHAGCNYDIECSPNQDCRFGDWYEWGACTAKCYGVKERSRKIFQHGRGTGHFCTGPLRETTPCAKEEGCPQANTDYSALDCKVSDWSEWGDCDRPCGSGQMVRTRHVVEPARHGGRPCSGDLAQVAPCTLTPCDDSCEYQDCAWSDWSDWGACDQCDGQMRRHRRVQSHAACGGRQCMPGDAEQIRKCPRFCHAPMFCGWAEWKMWSSCSTTCGYGRRERRRELRAMASPPAVVITPKYKCEGVPRDWNDDELVWCCKYWPQGGCEHEQSVRLEAKADASSEVRSRMAELAERTSNLESQRHLQMLSAWIAGSISVLAIHRVLRRSGGNPENEGFRPLATT